MKKDIKPIDWIVGYYLGYIILARFSTGLFCFEMLWFVLFLTWICVCLKKDFWFWKIDFMKSTHTVLILLNVMLIVGNIILGQINTINYVSVNPIAVINASICEEILFRGYIFDWLEKAIGQKNYFLIILLSSIIFSIAHVINIWSGYDRDYVVLQMIITFVAGVILGITRKQLNGIKECMLVHILFNLASYI